MKNKIGDLRDHLFATIEALRDPDTPLDIERARAIGLIAEKIVDTARVEVSFLEVSQQATGTDFFKTGDGLQQLEDNGERKNGVARLPQRTQ